MSSTGSRLSYALVSLGAAGAAELPLSAGAEEPLFQWAAASQKAHPVDFYVFGHFHVQVDMEVPGGARLFVLKDWMAPGSMPYLYCNGMSVGFGSSKNIE